MVDPFSMEPYRALVSGPSTVRISEMIEQGKILYVHMPIADREHMARVICTFIKLEYFRQVLMKISKAGRVGHESPIRPSFFLCDEFQQFFTTKPGHSDADFFERNRQSQHINLIATQNWPALLKMTENRPEIVENLLGNCATKIFLRNTDPKTNEECSKLFGKHFEMIGGQNWGTGQSGMRSSGANDGISQQFQERPKLPPDRFAQLAIPDKAAEISYSDTFIHSAGSMDNAAFPKKYRWRVHPL